MVGLGADKIQIAETKKSRSIVRMKEIEEAKLNQTLNDYQPYV